MLSLWYREADRVVDGITQGRYDDVEERHGECDSHVQVIDREDLSEAIRLLHEAIVGQVQR